MRFRIVEVRPRVYQVERRVLFFWISIKKWVTAQTYGAYLPEEFRSIMDAHVAIGKFCKKKEKPEYPKIVQQLSFKC